MTTLDSPGPSKRIKLDSPLVTTTATATTTATENHFNSTLFTDNNIADLAANYAKSSPYNHAILNQLFNHDFITTARNEIIDHINFTQKETDIYKIAQSGDLTNVSGLPAEELALLPTLLALRDSLYSAKFRAFLQSVTGCGPLSGIKTDMSCADYGQGSYLLNHDDVIGTRRISFILYLVLPTPAWEKEWGGALELYPVLEADSLNPDRPNVPTPKPSVSIPPNFNQFAFFQVQPGHSFHSVEEVVVEGDGIKGGVGARMSISGWFHKPIQGEEGYEGVEPLAPKSSLQQLYATTLLPAVPYESLPPLPLPLVPSADEIALLSPLINPAYFNPTTLAQLRPQFIETSQLVLANVLKQEIADEIQSLLLEEETLAEEGRRCNIGGRNVNKVMAQSTGEAQGWSITGPPHIQRFCSLPSSFSPPGPNRLLILLAEIETLFQSDAFRSFLACLTSLAPTSYTTQVRRFRPGLDYTLARGEGSEGEARLDVGLCLTPMNTVEQIEGWESGEVGGWELWLAGEDDGGDEATYGTGKTATEDNGEDDGPLLSLEPGWNRLHLVLRDPGVLRFVKYVSARAPGSRYDLSAEYEIVAVEEDEDQEDV